ncbi:hypothetical protein NSU02_07225 [Aeribacillus sp. FSL W8-0870]
MDHNKNVKNKKDVKQDLEFGNELGDFNAAKIYDILEENKRKTKTKGAVR